MFVDDDNNCFDKIYTRKIRLDFRKLNGFGFHASITMGKTLKTFILIFPPFFSICWLVCVCVRIWNAEPLNFSHFGIRTTETCTFIYILYWIDWIVCHEYRVNWKALIFIEKEWCVRINKNEMKNLKMGWKEISYKRIYI